MMGERKEQQRAQFLVVQGPDSLCLCARPSTRPPQARVFQTTHVRSAYKASFAISKEANITQSQTASNRLVQKILRRGSIP